MKTARFPTGDESVEAMEGLHLPALTGRVSASPARAAQKIAKLLTSAYKVDAAFDDLDYGRWHGHSIRDIGANEPEGIAAWRADPHARPHAGKASRCCRRAWSKRWKA